MKGISGGSTTLIGTMSQHIHSIARCKISMFRIQPHSQRTISQHIHSLARCKISMFRTQQHSQRAISQHVHSLARCKISMFRIQLHSQRTMSQHIHSIAHFETSLFPEVSNNLATLTAYNITAHTLPRTLRDIFVPGGQ